MKRILILLGCLALAGCATAPTDLIARQNIVAVPSEAQYVCPTEKLPDPSKLTDKQVAVLIEDLVRDNVECRNSLRSIHIFEEKADGTVKVDPKKVHAIRQQITASK